MEQNAHPAEALDLTDLGIKRRRIAHALDALARSERHGVHSQSCYTTCLWGVLSRDGVLREDPLVSVEERTPLEQSILYGSPKTTQVASWLGVTALDALLLTGPCVAKRKRRLLLQLRETAS